MDYKMVISETFKENGLPIMIDIGKTIFYCTATYATYYIMRKQYREGMERVKASAIGYICLRWMDTFVTIVDKVANNIH